MTIDRDALVAAAAKARQNAYCPYSQYMVGAAVLGEDGNIYTGCNIENASYGMTVCGERVAIFNMVSSGCRKFVALALVTGGDDHSDGGPCLACRQVMTEFCRDWDVPVFDAGLDGTVFTHTMRELCPFPFVIFEKNADYHD